MSLYEILDIDVNATVDIIKKAFKRLAGKHHPDKGGDTEKFKKIQHAYAILSNPKLRDSYDKTGSDKQYVDPDAEARSNLAMLFTSVIQQNQKGNIVDIVEMLIEQNISRGTAELADLKNKKTALENKLGRVVNKSGSNIYEGVLHSQLGATENGIEKAKHFVDTGAKMKSLLEGYEDTKPDEVMAGGWSGTINVRMG